MKIEENPCADAVPEDLIRDYTGIATSLVSDNMDRMPGAVGLMPRHAGGLMIGTALTVRTRHGDNLAIHAALDIARPGDVLVIEGGGDTSQALIGEIIMARALSLGVAGFVIDGAIRDSGAIARSTLPCYACAITHRGPYKNGPGVLNVPVSVGGMVVNPGDLVIGDEDGALALAPQTARRILPQVRAQEQREREKLDEYARHPIRLARV